MNFYLTAIDSLLNKPGDNQAIGIILCKDKNKVIAEYSLRDIKKPIGISAYKTATKIKNKLPDIKIMEKEMDNYLLKEEAAKYGK